MFIQKEKDIISAPSGSMMTHVMLLSSINPRYTDLGPSRDVYHIMTQIHLIYFSVWILYEFYIDVRRGIWSKESFGDLFEKV